MSENITTFYSIPAPYSMNGDTMIEVYGDGNMGWYEWRVLAGDKVQQDTGTEGSSHLRGRQYGSAEVALRDALMVMSDLGDPHQLAMLKAQH